MDWAADAERKRGSKTDSRIPDSHMLRGERTESIGYQMRVMSPLVLRKENAA